MYNLYKKQFIILSEDFNHLSIDKFSINNNFLFKSFSTQ